MNRTAAVGAAAALAAPVAVVLALVGVLTTVVTVGLTDPGPALDPAKIPPLARAQLTRITALTARHCPELPPAWVVAEVTAESGWDPRAFSRDRNGGAAGLYQLNQANWTAAGGHPWATAPPPDGADIFDPARHLDVAIPFVCANLRTATEHLRATGKPTAPLDAMLVCHIAGCARVTGSATGIPTAGEAGCDRRCADLVTRYLATVHRNLALYSASRTAVDIRDLPAPAPLPGPDGRCTRPDPTSRGCLTPATRHAFDQILAAFGPPGPAAPIRTATCWDPHPQNPRSDHPAGRACDLFPTSPATYPAGRDLAQGWRIATWLRAHADTLRVRYLIWQGRYWDPTTLDEQGWGHPYTGGGIYDRDDATGGHYDHIHVSIRS